MLLEVCAESGLLIICAVYYCANEELVQGFVGDDINCAAEDLLCLCCWRCVLVIASVEL